MDPVILAQYLVNRFGHVPGGVTPLKVQKLLYYVKAWSLVNGENLVDGTFYKWRHGPVNRQVYDHFKPNRSDPLQIVNLAPDQEPQGEAREFVDFIGHSYARFPALVLSKMTHDEAPWKETPPDHEICPVGMQAFYSRQPFAANIPLDYDHKPYVAVQSDMDRAFTLDMSVNDAVRATTFKSYREYLDRLSRAGYVAREDWLNRLLA